MDADRSLRRNVPAGKERANAVAAYDATIGFAVTSGPHAACVHRDRAPLGQAGHNVVTATRDGFLAGFDEILVIGGIVALAGAVLSLALVRESEIERESATGVVPEPSVARTARP